MIELDIRDATVRLAGHNNQGDVQYIVNVTAHAHDAPVTFIEIGTLIPDQKDVEANKLAAIQQAKAGHAAAQQELRAVDVNRRAVEAAVGTARAAVRLAEIDLENTAIRAPGAGQVGEIGVKLGQYVVPGTQLLALVPSQVWIVANFKEAQTAQMRPGQPATFRVSRES